MSAPSPQERDILKAFFFAVFGFLALFGGSFVLRDVSEMLVHFVPLVLFIIAIGLAISNLLRGMRDDICTKAPGIYCQRCGYDMRSTPTRCPECSGTSIRTISKSVSVAKATADVIFSIIFLLTISGICAGIILVLLDIVLHPRY